MSVINTNDIRQKGKTMRIIDADALIDTFESKKAKAHDKSMKHLYGQNKNDKLYRKDCETESRCEYVLSVLRTTPTVDAVPVEQIESFIDWLEQNGYTLLKKAIINALHDYRADGERRTDGRIQTI